MQAGEVDGRGLGSRGGQLGGLEVIFPVLVAQLEWGEAQLLQELLVPVQGLLLREVVRTAVMRTRVDRAGRCFQRSRARWP